MTPKFNKKIEAAQLPLRTEFNKYVANVFPGLSPGSRQYRELWLCWIASAWTVGNIFADPNNGIMHNRTVDEIGAFERFMETATPAGIEAYLEGKIKGP